ncbi:ABC transporter F family member 4 [Aplysia californica]|uniref:ABC transporter F family member 4 n=1 Tax=Aplysia californica TaxID=6500 RepID=A0ABM0JRV5_APLCA|nr:ABC transporter F family member 4 [Aplysia californica]
MNLKISVALVVTLSVLTELAVAAKGGKSKKDGDLKSKANSIKEVFMKLWPACRRSAVPMEGNGLQQKKKQAIPQPIPEPWFGICKMLLEMEDRTIIEPPLNIDNCKGENNEINSNRRDREKKGENDGEKKKKPGKERPKDGKGQEKRKGGRKGGKETDDGEDTDFNDDGTDQSLAGPKRKGGNEKKTQRKEERKGKRAENNSGKGSADQQEIGFKKESGEESDKERKKTDGKKPGRKGKGEKRAKTLDGNEDGNANSAIEPLLPQPPKKQDRPKGNDESNRRRDQNMGDNGEEGKKGARKEDRRKKKGQDSGDNADGRNAVNALPLSPDATTEGEEGLQTQDQNKKKERKEKKSERKKERKNKGKNQGGAKRAKEENNISEIQF